MSAVTFQFWNDVEYQDYDSQTQQVLNIEFRRNPRPVVVQLQRGKYELQDFNAVEFGYAKQVNLASGWIRHVLLKPVYKLHKSPVLDADRIRFQFLDGGWLDYPRELQQQLRAVIQCAPRPVQFCFSVSGHSYRLQGLDKWDAGGQLSQVNTKTGMIRPVRAFELGKSSVHPRPAICKAELAIWRGGKPERLAPDAYAKLLNALRASGPRADRVDLPSGHVVENFQSLEVGGAGVRCNEEWIPLQLHLPRDHLMSQDFPGSVLLPHELEVAHSDIRDHGEFCVLPKSSEKDDKVCAICLGELEPDDEGDSNMDEHVFKLRCGHMFHAPCVEEWFKSKQKCPQCQTNFGKVIGDGPREGSMSWRLEHSKLAGHPESTGTIVVMFDFPAGVDERGTRYAGRRERGFLPATVQGGLLLELFKVALRRRVMFGIGHSMTTGQYRPTFQVHIKTNTQGGAARHGYPDPTYFQRAFEELRTAGVSVADVLRD